MDRAAADPIVKFAAGTQDSMTGKPYFYVSDCRNYTVTIPLTSEYKKYGAWHVIREGGERVGALELGVHPSAAIAKRACEEHANARKTAPT